ncbi:transporter substrate-binding domain-containing protein [Nocardioides sp. DS6]|uniref:Transporter substrate-binding domain-containing protein n=1 Tax=Nocardioides eburneus TaxID=3231482 RepID=A0ABV3T0P5_9ACTN
MAAPAQSEQDVDETLASRLPASLKNGTVRIAVTADLPKVNFTADGTQRGFEPDLITAAAQRLGLTVTWVKSNNPLAELQSGKADGMATFLNDTKEREANGGAWVDYLQAGVSAVVAKCNPQSITSDTDLCGKKVAAATGTVQLAQLTTTKTAGSILKQCKAAGKPAPKAVQAQTNEAAVTALSAGRADALVIDTPIATAIAQSANGALTIGYTEPVEGQPIGVFVLDTDLGKALQAAYQSLVDDGTYGQILDGYAVDTGRLKTITVNGATR